METNKDIFDIPQDYFSKLEDNVLKRYGRQRRVRKVNIFASLSVVSIAVLSLSLYFVNNNVSEQQFTQTVSLIKDTVAENNAVTVTNDVESTSPNGEEIAVDKKEILKTPQVNRKKINTEVLFSKEELDYLENFLDEDNYELLTNNIYYK